MVTIRRATLLDRPSVESVYASVVGTPFVLSDDEWRRWIGLDGVVVAEENNRVIGFGGIDVTAEEQLRWVYLLPEFQRGGVGSRILHELESMAWSSGLPSIRLHSTPGAVQFYAKRGYTRVPDQEQLGHDHDGVEMVKLR
jgi:GNAT superfamily N-acetyltransferase